MGDFGEVNDESSMWNIIEYEMGLQIPKYLKNLTNLCGFDTPLVLGKMTAEHIVQMESFAREKMSQLIPAGANWMDYYSNYYICPKLFEIPIGHRILLREVQNFVNLKFFANKHYFAQTARETGEHTEENKLSYVNKECGKPEENPEVPVIDIQGRHQDLYTLVKSWLIRNVADVQPQIDDEFTPESIIVEYKLNNYTAKIKCPLCESTYRAHYEYYGNKQKKRWVRANFERHVKNHLSPYKDIQEAITQPNVLENEIKLEMVE